MKTEVVVTDTIRDAIVALQNGESSAFKSAISAELMDRAMGAIQVQRIGAAQSIFDNDSGPEEVSDEEI